MKQSLRRRLGNRPGREFLALLALVGGLGLCVWATFVLVRGEFVFRRGELATVYEGAAAYVLAGGLIVITAFLIRFGVNPWRKENRELEDESNWDLRR